METKYFKLIFFVSLILSVIGIVSEILMYFLWVFKSIYLYIGFDQPSLNIYNLIFYILLLFGTIFFYISKGKELRLIRFFYSALLISNIFIVMKFIFVSIIYKIPAEIYISRIISSLLCMFYAFLGYKILKITAVGRELDLIKKANSDIVEVTETPKIERFLHWFSDNIIITFLMFNVLGVVMFFYEFKNERTISEWLGHRFIIIGFLLVIVFIYYPFFEKIFGATPGKFLTNSRVVNSKSEIPDTRNIFERALYRNIPFEVLSFFGKKGWHDSISKTYVVKEKDKGVPSIYIVGVFILCFVVFCFYLYQNFADKF